MFPIIYGVLARPSGFEIDYLFNENFTIDQAAPLVVPLATDGVGDWDAITTGAAYSISGGKLIINTIASADIKGNSLSRVAVVNGVVAVWRTDTFTSGARPLYLLIGAGSVGYDRSAFAFRNKSLFGVAALGAANRYFVFGTNREMAIENNLLLAVGGFDVKFIGPGYIQNRNIGAMDATITGNKIGSPHGNWDDIDAMRTAVLASPSGGETGDVDKDSHLYVRINTLPTTTATLAFRIQDASNRWEINITSAGVMTLDEVVAGTPVTRITVVGVAAGDVIFCHANDEAIGLMRHVAAQTMVRYTSAANFKSETGYSIVSLGGATMVDFEVWNTFITGEDLARLEAM